MSIRTLLVGACCLLIVLTGGCDSIGPRVERGEQVLIWRGDTPDGWVDPFIVDVGLERVVRREVIRHAHRFTMFAFTPDRRRLIYVPDSEPLEVVVLDMATLEYLERRPLDAVVGAERSGVLGWPSMTSADGDRLFVANWRPTDRLGGTFGIGVGIGVMDTHTLEVVGVIEGLISAGPMTAVPPSSWYPEGAIAAFVYADTTATEVSDPQEIALIHPERLEVMARVGLPFPDMGGDLVADPDGTAVLLNDRYEVMRIELADGSISGRRWFGVWGNLHPNPDSTMLYRTQRTDVWGHPASGLIDVMDFQLEPGEPIDLTGVRRYGMPHTVELAFGKDRRTMYVVAGGARISLGSFPIQPGHLIVVDSGTGRVRSVISLGVYNPGFPVVLP